jgi:hypothetical protein
MSEVWTITALKEYVDQRFAASETATTTALAAAEKAVTAALTAAEKAVTKAEASQEKVNVTQNEFRGTLKDQAADLMPRAETELLIKDLRGQLDDLRTSRDVVAGRSSGIALSANTIVVALTILIAAVGLYLSLH